MTRRLIKRIAYIGAIAVVAIANGSPASAIEMTPELRKIVDGAKAEGRLVVESPPGPIGGGNAAVKEAADWIKRELGVTLTTAYKPTIGGRGVTAQLYAELQANVKASTDVYPAAAVPIDDMLDKGLFRRVPWTKLMPGRITEQIAEADGRAL